MNQLMDHLLLLLLQLLHDLPRPEETGGLCAGPLPLLDVLTADVPTIERERGTGNTN